MNKKPNFYLTSSEDDTFSEPRDCYILKKIGGVVPTRSFLVKVNPPALITKKIINNMPVSLGADEVDTFLLSPRHVGYVIDPIVEWPFYVYISRLLIPLSEIKDKVDVTNTELIAWGELYPTYERALKKE